MPKGGVPSERLCYHTEYAGGGAFYFACFEHPMDRNYSLNTVFRMILFIYYILHIYILKFKPFMLGFFMFDLAQEQTLE